MAQDNEVSPARPIAALAKARHSLSKYSDDIIIVDNVEDIREAKRTGKIGVGFHFQGGHRVRQA